jgi:hypothetical protein
MPSFDHSLFLRRCVVLLGLFALAGTAASASPDTVVGSMTAGGKTYKLTHVWARRQPSLSDPSKMVVVVLVTDGPVPQNVLDDKFRLELTNIAREGKVHGVSVTLGLDKKPSGTGWTYAQEFGGAIVNRDDQHTFQPAVFNDTRIEGKLSGKGSFGDQTWSYTAEVKAAISALK